MHTSTPPSDSGDDPSRPLDASLGGARTRGGDAAGRTVTSGPFGDAPSPRLESDASLEDDPGGAHGGRGGALFSADRFEVLERLGEGGMGVVYLARDVRLGRLVALKRLGRDEDASRRGVARFLKEAQAVAALSHPGILSIHELAEDAEGPYLVLELAEGGDLASRVRAQGALAATEAVRVIREVAQALAYAHGKGIVHRDVKPHNILVASDGRVKLADFGLARLPSEDELSRTGVGMGTLAYMAPEQRVDAKHVDWRADIYALGKTLYHLVSGEVPDSVDLEAVPEPLRDILRRCLKSKPDERYASVAELLADLDLIAPVLGGRGARGAPGSGEPAPEYDLLPSLASEPAPRAAGLAPGDRGPTTPRPPTPGRPRGFYQGTGGGYGGEFGPGGGPGGGGAGAPAAAAAPAGAPVEPEAPEPAPAPGAPAGAAPSEEDRAARIEEAWRAAEEERQAGRYARALRYLRMVRELAPDDARVGPALEEAEAFAEEERAENQARRKIEESARREASLKKAHEETQRARAVGDLEGLARALEAEIAARPGEEGPRTELAALKARLARRRTLLRAAAGAAVLAVVVLGLLVWRSQGARRDADFLAKAEAAVRAGDADAAATALAAVRPEGVAPARRAALERDIAYVRDRREAEEAEKAGEFERALRALERLAATAAERGEDPAAYRARMHSTRLERGLAVARAFGDAGRYDVAADLLGDARRLAGADATALARVDAVAALWWAEAKLRARSARPSDARGPIGALRRLGLGPSEAELAAFEAEVAVRERLAQAEVDVATGRPLEAVRALRELEAAHGALLGPELEERIPRALAELLAAVDVARKAGRIEEAARLARGRVDLVPPAEREAAEALAGEVERALAEERKRLAEDVARAEAERLRLEEERLKAEAEWRRRTGRETPEERKARAAAEERAREEEYAKRRREAEAKAEAERRAKLEKETAEQREELAAFLRFRNVTDAGIALFLYDDLVRAEVDPGRAKDLIKGNLDLDQEKPDLTVKEMAEIAHRAADAGLRKWELVTEVTRAFAKRREENRRRR